MGGVHTLGVKPPRLKHEINVLAKELHILEHTGESLGLIFIGNDNTHNVFGDKGLSYLHY